jgi:hypothetical protein
MEYDSDNDQMSFITILKNHELALTRVSISNSGEGSTYVLRSRVFMK